MLCAKPLHGQILIFDLSIIFHENKNEINRDTMILKNAFEMSAAKFSTYFGQISMCWIILNKDPVASKKDKSHHK